MNDFFFLQADRPMWPASANVFVIKDDDGLILIDVGCGLRRFTKKLFKKFAEFELDINEIHTIVISHAHPDHMGGMDELLKKLNENISFLNIIINELEKAPALNNQLLNDSFDLYLPLKYYKTEVENRIGNMNDINDSFRMLCAMSQLPQDINISTIKDGDILKLGNYKFKVLTTPGHAPGHTSFYEINNKFLLSGDLVGEKGTAWYSPSSGGATGYLSSLNKIEKLSIKYIYPSHGAKFYNVSERINEIRQKIISNENLILNKIREKPQTTLDLVNLLFNSPTSQFFPGVVIVESHLIKLENEGKIERNNDLIKLQ
ncbi:MAG: MBL fold metallo-hydrolase [Candidatus Helarchaeota archaeon]